MAASTASRKTLPGFYIQLNESANWFLEPVKRHKSLQARIVLWKELFPNGTSKELEYLVKWCDYSAYFSSWEPEENLTTDLIRSYHKPVIETRRLQENIDNLLLNLTSKLKSKSRAPVSFVFQHDCLRYLFGDSGSKSRDGKAVMLNKGDFLLCNFFIGWDQCLDRNKDRVMIQFPVRVTLLLSNSSSITVFKDAKLTKLPKMPIEKMKIDFVRKPFSCVS